LHYYSIELKLKYSLGNIDADMSFLLEHRSSIQYQLHFCQALFIVYTFKCLSLVLFFNRQKLSFTIQLFAYAHHILKHILSALKS
jgi:hypothetical protein